MFPSVFSLKILGIAVAVALAVGGTLGWRVHKAFSDSRWYRAQLAASQATIKTLNGRIAATNTAATADADRAVKDKAEIDRLEREKDDLVRTISAGVCLDAADVDRMRATLWPGARTKK